MRSSRTRAYEIFRDRLGQTPTEARERLRRRKARLAAGPLEGIAPSFSMAALGMSYQE